jgi:hypothetical protein
MITKLLLPLFLLSFISISFGQNNPVENVTWSQSYVSPNNFFELQWDEPLQPHDALIGYNIYRNNELYRFQTETSLYHLYTDIYGFVANCDINFLILDNQNQPYTDGFEIQVAAVYNPGPTESNLSLPVHANPAALHISAFTQEKAILYPNPTHGVLNIGNVNLEKIMVYDISGKAIQEFGPASQIDLGNLSKGMYFIKLFSVGQIIVDKIIIE